MKMLGVLDHFSLANFNWSYLKISDILSSVPLQRILFMKQQGRALYQRYFSSVEKITITAVQVTLDLPSYKQEN